MIALPSDKLTWHGVCDTWQNEKEGLQMSNEKEKTKNEAVCISASGAASRYSLNVNTLANLRYRREGPKYFKRGRSAFYRIDDFEAWLFATPILTKDSLEK